MGVRLDTAKLDQIIAKFPREAAAVVKAGANQVKARAANMAPVDTGALRNSIEASLQNDLLWLVGDGVDYGIYQELGTSRMGAHPFMRPAVEMTRREYTSMWVDLFNRL